MMLCVGKAVSKGATTNKYVGMKGRCSGYISRRLKGSTKTPRAGQQPSPHETRLEDGENDWVLRVGAEFQGAASNQQVSLHEDLLILLMQVVQQDGAAGQKHPEQLELIKYWQVLQRHSYHAFVIWLTLIARRLICLLFPGPA